MTYLSGEGDGTTLLQDLYEARHGAADRAYTEHLNEIVKRDLQAQKEGKGNRGFYAVAMLGKRFGKLVVKRRDGRTHGMVTWLCQCDCGETTVAIGAVLRRGGKKSCGCLRVENGRRLAAEQNAGG